MADLSMALTGRFTDHHALMCRLHLDRIKIFDDAVKDLDAKIAPLVARYPREAGLLKTLPGFGDVIVAGWLGAIGPAPHQHFATAQRLASWAAVCPGNYMSAKKGKGGTQRRLPDGPGLIPDRPPGCPGRPPADGTNRRRVLTRARKAPNFVSANDP